jgi:hypothetical protein
MTLKKATYIAVLIASVMAIGWFGRQNLKGATYECDIAKDMADTNLRQAYDYPDPDNKLIERAGHYASYYEAFCD